jgi:hypothetical protein
VPAEKVPVASPSALPGDGATRAFSRPGSEPIPAQPEIPSGPSPYTQIISAVKLRPGAEAAERQGDAAASPAAGAKFAAPMPKIPAMTAPPLPPPPAVPKIAARAAAAISKVPKGTAPQPPVSYWALVLTLTVLFSIAVLLVLYFVLKH